MNYSDVEKVVKLSSQEKTVIELLNLMKKGYCLKVHNRDFDSLPKHLYEDIASSIRVILEKNLEDISEAIHKI